jgi:exonuclease III
MNQDAIIDSKIESDVMGSDHCPIELILNVHKL